GLRNMTDYKEFLAGLFKVLKPGGSVGIHDYSLAKTAPSRLYWRLIGYGFVLPLCTLASGTSEIFR
ncbi:MAG: class I SAM-dependent methyltransferase, partial [Lentisphaeria bacterium]|nr:class I SAM-dependent methyltransferase [Lentisphaeria bacterium]